jgi:hypothetical protein
MEQSKGLGDDMAKLFIVTGIHSVVKSTTKTITKLTGIEADCGCSDRQEKLNRIFPYKTDQK